MHVIRNQKCIRENNKTLTRERNIASWKLLKIIKSKWGWIAKIIGSMWMKWRYLKQGKMWNNFEEQKFLMSRNKINKFKTNNGNIRYMTEYKNFTE